MQPIMAQIQLISAVVPCMNCGRDIVQIKSLKGSLDLDGAWLHFQNNENTVGPYWCLERDGSERSDWHAEPELHQMRVI